MAKRIGGETMLTADRQRLFKLMEESLCGGKRDYLLFHQERFLYTVQQVDSLIEGREHCEILEVGPEDYLLARLLKKAFGERVTIECVEHPLALRTNVTARNDNEFRTCYIDLEKEGLATGKKYDLILCCEVIEHLLYSPTRFLYHLGQALRHPGGRLLITTDNVCRMTNIIKLLAGVNIFYYLQPSHNFRHNREYTMKELLGLLEGVGFEIVESRYFNFFPHTTQKMYWGMKAAFLPTALFTRFKRHMMVIGTVNNHSALKLCYPPWLYEYPDEMRRLGF